MTNGATGIETKKLRDSAGQRTGGREEAKCDSLAEVEDGEDEDREEHVGEELVHEDPLERLSGLGEEGENTGGLQGWEQSVSSRELSGKR